MFTPKATVATQLRLHVAALWSVVRLSPISINTLEPNFPKFNSAVLTTELTPRHEQNNLGTPKVSQELTSGATRADFGRSLVPRTGEGLLFGKILSQGIRI